MERASTLEQKPSTEGSQEPDARLRGVWSWGGKKLEFAAGGVLLVNKSRAGKWTWGRADSKEVVLFIPDTGDFGVYARFSKSDGNLLHTRTTKDNTSDARKE